VKVLAGVGKPDSGIIRIGDQTVAIDSPVIAKKHGVGVVHQRLSLFADHSVPANLFVNREPLRNGLISRLTGAVMVLALALDRLIKLLRNRRAERIPENLHA